jgi:hypothetical protein
MWWCSGGDRVGLDTKHTRGLGKHVVSDGFGDGGVLELVRTA